MSLFHTTATFITIVVCSCSPLAEVTGTDPADEAASVTSEASTTTSASTGQTTTEAETAMASPICADAIVDPGEQCDDGNTIPNDGCEEDCRFTPHCGNGITEPGEQCDDGNDAANDGCEFDCRITAVCGNGQPEVGEECDDGNSYPGDSCRNNCKLARCGDSYRSDSEECDDGNMSDADACLTTCLLATCGDGHVRTGREECDDGNQIDDDGCRRCFKPRKVFVSSEIFNGNLGGLVGADKKCRDAAQSAGLSSPSMTWHAWLSDAVDSPSTFMDTSFDGAYRRIDDEIVAYGWSGLTSGESLIHPINITEKKAMIPKKGSWTNVTYDGHAKNGPNCANWSESDVAFGGFGATDETSTEWTDLNDTPCWTELHIYCFQDIL